MPINVDVQNPIRSTVTSGAFSEVFSFKSSELTDIACAIQTIETRHLNKLQTTVSELHRSEDIDAVQFDFQLQDGLRIIRDQFEDRFRAAMQEWQTEKEKLKADVESLRRHSNLEGVLKEIAQTEAMIGELKAEIDSAIDTPNVELSQIIQKNSQLEELRAYARGLSFRIGKRD